MPVGLGIRALRFEYLVSSSESQGFMLLFNSKTCSGNLEAHSDTVANYLDYDVDDEDDDDDA